MKKVCLSLLLALCMVIAAAIPSLPARAASGLPRLVDDADILTDDEEKEILAQLDRISEEQECDVLVYTADSLEGKTATEFADDYYDYRGYGMGPAKDGILLMICMEERDWAISTCGYGITAFTDAGQEYMMDRILPYLSSGNYGRAFMTYADMSEDLLKQARAGEPYDVRPAEKEKRGVSPFWLLGDAGIGFGTALMGANRKKRKLKTVYRKKQASIYMQPNGFVAAFTNDSLINTRITHTRIQRDRDNDSFGGGGGSTVHTSSSGTTHGGSSGKF